MRIQATEVFVDIDDAIKEGNRYIFLRGSTRSGKTVASIQYIVIECLKRAGISATIARATQVSLKNTILVDFKEIMNTMEIWDWGTFNKVDNVYTFPNGSVIRFIGMDDTTSRLKGMKSDIALVDEINSVDIDPFEQLNIRLSDWVLCPYNPELTPDHWILKYEQREDAKLLISNWRQNSFLDDRTRKAISDLKLTNPDLYEIYSEGKIVEPREKIFREVQTYSGNTTETKQVYYGIDYGYSSDPTAVIKVTVEGNNLYCEEVLYEKGLTNQDLAFLLKEKGITRESVVVADSSEPKSIQELNREGLSVIGVKKGAGSILYGIQKMKSFNIMINETSENLIREWNNYKFKKDRSGNITNIPIGDDHAIDALRYVVLQFLDNLITRGKYIIV